MRLFRAITKTEKDLLEKGYLECRNPQLYDRVSFLNYTDYGQYLSDSKANRKHFFLTFNDALSYIDSFNRQPDFCYETLTLSENPLKAIAIFNLPLQFIEDYLNIGIYGEYQKKRCIVESAIIVDKLRKFEENKGTNEKNLKLKKGVIQEITENIDQEYKIESIDFYLEMLDGKISENNKQRINKQISLFKRNIYRR